MKRCRRRGEVRRASDARQKHGAVRREAGPVLGELVPAASKVRRVGDLRSVAGQCCHVRIVLSTQRRLCPDVGAGQIGRSRVSGKVDVAGVVDPATQHVVFSATAEERAPHEPGPVGIQLGHEGIAGTVAPALEHTWRRGKVLGRGRPENTHVVLSVERQPAPWGFITGPAPGKCTRRAGPNPPRVWQRRCCRGRLRVWAGSSPWLWEDRKTASCW